MVVIIVDVGGAGLTVDITGGGGAVDVAGVTETVDKRAGVVVTGVPVTGTVAV